MVFAMMGVPKKNNACTHDGQWFLQGIRINGSPSQDEPCFKRNRTPCADQDWNHIAS
jgi:hypothetical protein